MRILRLELVGSIPLSVQFPAPALNTDLIVVSGPNGSGKSLAVAAMMAALGNNRLRDPLAAAGVQRVLLSAQVGEHIFHIEYDTANGQREFESETAADPLHQIPHGHVPSGQQLVSETFESVSVIRSGRLDLVPRALLETAVITAMRSPLERELDGWKARQLDLAGPDGDGGKLAAARAELEETEQVRSRVEAKWRELEMLRSRQQVLNGRLSEARSDGEVLAAEIEELNRQCVMADRAARIESWMEEIRREIRDVESAREKHADLQTRMDHLEQKFRGVPDELNALLDRYAAVRASEMEITANLLERLADRARRQTEVEAINRELAALQHPPDEPDFARQEELRRQIEAVNAELTESLRGRIELVRRREGVKEQLAREYAPFAALSAAEREQIEELIAEHGSEPSPPPAEPLAQERKKRLESLKSVLRERFRGFERLPHSTPDLLRQYHDARRMIATLSGDLDGLHSRIAMLERKTHPRHSITAGLVVGVLGFAAGSVLWSWDIGLFTALAASGITLLVFRYANRGAEVEVQSAAAAEAMIARRLEESRAAKAKLEPVLGPLAGVGTLDTALKNYQEYLRFREQVADLESSVAEEASGTMLPAPPSGNGELPPSLSGVPLPVLRRQFAAFRDLEEQQRQVEEAWSEFERGGAQAERIRSAEARIESLQAELLERMASDQKRRQNNEARQNQLQARLAELTAAADDEVIARLEGELSAVQADVAALVAAAPDLLRNGDVESVRADWNERESLRTRLREIRSLISAKPAPEELRAREALLAEEMSAMRQKLCARDPLYMLDGTAADFAAKYTGQLRAARSEQRAIEERVNEVQRELASVNPDELLAELGQERPLDELENAVAACRDRVESIERDLTTTRELIALIEDEIAEKESALPGELAGAVDRRVRALTDERCLGVEERDGEWYAILTDGASRKLDDLSDGTRELLSLAVRLGVLDVIAGTNRDPVVWDEPFTHLDARNLARLKEELTKLAVSRQVILLTRHADIERWGATVRLAGEPRELPDRAVP